tara:strand:- start:477 stop:1010 length:534 start_codon:yes stop_codon:yes gene_type:complete
MSTIFDLRDEEGDNTQISLDELYDKQEKAAIRKLQLYNKVLAKVHNKIKLISRQQNKEYWCWFAVPQFILGSPEYEFNVCLDYLVEKLSDNGLKVKVVNPNILLISWKDWIPQYARDVIKEKLGKKIDGNGIVIEDPKSEKEETVDNNKYKTIVDTTPIKNNIYDDFFKNKINKIHK